MDYPNDLSLSLGYDLPASPRGFNLIAPLVLADVLRVQKTILKMSESRDSVIACLKLLVDDEHGTPPCFSWSLKESIITRLKRYLLLASLQSNSNLVNAPLISLRHYFESVERQARDLNFALKDDCPNRLCKEKIQRLSSTVESCAHHYAAWLKAFEDDENVLLYVLQRREEIEECFGKHYFNELLSNTFGTTGEVSELLLTKYVQRGFNHFVPALQKLISTLEFK